jgi:hypothetical protein
MRSAVAGKMMVICAAALLCWRAAGADDSALSYSSGMVSLLDEHPTVRMATCAIAADIYERESKVRCQFEFVNEGGSTMVTMGFPAYAGYEGGERSAAPQLRDFRSWVDGKEIATEMAAGEEESRRGPERWYVKRVWFEQGMRRTVRNTYTQPNGEDTSGARWFPYTLSTGKSWHGPIGKVTVTLRWRESHEWLVHRLRAVSTWVWQRSTDGRSLSWQGESVEPQHDISLRFYPGWQGLFCDGFSMATMMVHVSGEHVETQIRPLAQILRAGVKFDDRAKAARLIRGEQRIVLPVGESYAEIDGERLPLPTPARLDIHNSLWANADVLWRHFGRRIEIDREEHVVRVYTGQPIVTRVRLQGPGDQPSSTVHVVEVEGALMGEIGPMLYQVEALGKTPLNPEGYPAPECHTICMMSADGETSQRRLTFRVGSREAVLDTGVSTRGGPGRLLEPTRIELPAAPYVSVKGTSMFPVGALCEAFGLGWDYDEDEKLLTISRRA